MYTTMMIVVTITIVANTGIVVADLTRAKFVLDNSAEVGVPVTWLPVLGLLKGAGAIGLLAGLVGFRALGVMAAAGLVVFYIGAMVAHVRKRVFYNLAFPAIFLALAMGSLWLLVVG